jgi:hypothetical protein
MEWIPVTKKPSEKKKYMCFVPECDDYNKHWAEYYWDGENFRDNTYLGKNRIVEASHYMIIEEPQ